MNIDIILTDPDGTYKPDDIIRGTVTLDLTSTQNIQNILCKFVGNEETSWATSESLYDERTNTMRSGIVHYKGEHNIISCEEQLAKDLILPIGRHDFPFAITVPKRIPSSYSSNNGWIKFGLAVTIQNDLVLYEKEIPIHVKAPINFNDIRGEIQLEPIVYQNEEIIWHCCYAGDPVTMDLILEREAYTVNEPITFKLEVNNKSDREISEIDVTLTLVVETTAAAPRRSRKYYEKLLTGAKARGLAHGQQELYSFRFQVPDVIDIPNFIGSTLFRQKCVLKAECKIQDSDTKLDVQTELKLGHIPVERSRRITHPHGPVRRVHSSGAINRPLGFNFFNTSDNASAPPADYQPTAPRTTDDIDNLPPSYEEAIRATFDARKTKKD
ncbi:arrestin domain-containing protein 15 [Diabrotica virgifera virgifera]|uniref:Arrestin C-terminal-like domain-containing protein n=1 Tax=Diabrotica virgifera virgifera TaxID=50390 RepID=A0ABM5I9N8_DIAVI|nr:arrestin domain-containing protein 15 [Diabrotica virgifera virgifera]XP_028128093.2 arrestin domain-containing protein 15 [Diabrotica virgifera virgifera]XP_028128094.2 arrestin domain-containing protein 15 [Diabrotica virgifera virgifera]